jgi:hypothetical protein
MEVDRAAVVQPDGKLVVAGGIKRGYPGEPAFALKRYNADGSTDSTFGNGGNGPGLVYWSV